MTLSFSFEVLEEGSAKEKHWEMVEVTLDKMADGESTTI